MQSADGLQELTIDFGGTQITDAVAEELRGSMTAGLQQLTLDLQETRITDGFAEMLRGPLPHVHCLWVSGGITWCQVCGAYGEARLRGLLRACPGPLRGRGGRATTLQRLRAGRHPLTMELLPRAKPLR